MCITSSVLRDPVDLFDGPDCDYHSKDASGSWSRAEYKVLVAVLSAVQWREVNAESTVLRAV